MTTSDKHKEALEILEPMIQGGFDSYMFEPEVGGWLNEGELIVSVDKSVGYLSAGEFEVSYIAIETWNGYHNDYLPTMAQLWEQVLRFNDEQKAYKVEHSTMGKCLMIFINQNIGGRDAIWMDMKCDSILYTNTDLLYLALLKVCVEIWKIELEAK